MSEMGSPVHFTGDSLIGAVGMTGEGSPVPTSPELGAGHWSRTFKVRKQFLPRCATHVEEETKGLPAMATEPERLATPRRVQKALSQVRQNGEALDHLLVEVHRANVVDTGSRRRRSKYRSPEDLNLDGFLRGEEAPAAVVDSVGTAAAPAAPITVPNWVKAAKKAANEGQPRQGVRKDASRKKGMGRGLKAMETTIMRTVQSPLPWERRCVPSTTSTPAHARVAVGNAVDERSADHILEFSL